MADDFRAWRQRTQRRFLSQARGAASPCALVVLGEPWATGGVLAGHAAFRLVEEGGSVRVSARECACLHPDFLFLLRTDPRRLLDTVYPAAEALAAEILESAALRRLHVVCEVGASSLAAFIKTANDLRSAGYLIHVLVGAGPPLAPHVLGELATRLNFGPEGQELLSGEARGGWEALPDSFDRLVAEMPWTTVSIHHPNGILIEGASGPDQTDIQRCRKALREAVRGRLGGTPPPAKEAPRPASSPADTQTEAKGIAPKPVALEGASQGPGTASGAKEFVDGSGRRVVLRGFGKSPASESPGPSSTSANTPRSPQVSRSTGSQARGSAEQAKPVSKKMGNEETAHPDIARTPKFSTTSALSPGDEPPTAVDPAAVESRPKGSKATAGAPVAKSKDVRSTDQPVGRGEAERGSRSMSGKSEGERTESTPPVPDKPPAQPTRANAKAEGPLALPDLSRLSEPQRRAVERRIKWVRQIRRIASRDEGG